MIGLKEVFTGNTFHYHLHDPTVSVSSTSGHTLALKLTKEEIITEAAYEGPLSPWLSSLCNLLPGKHLHEASQLGLSSWEKFYGQDPVFCDIWAQKDDSVFFLPLELLKAALNKYQGREYLYKDASPLVCRCFGVRASDLIEYLKHAKSPSLIDLGEKTKAGMGCRSCKPQLELWVAGKKIGRRYYKETSFADWLLCCDEKLKSFPLAKDWNMQVEEFKGNGIIISFDKSVSQKEEEEMARELQLYLAAEVDPDLGFFLARSRQR